MKNLILIILSSFITTLVLSIETGGIAGQLMDQSNQKPIPFATVRIVEISKGDITDISGNFLIKEIPPGKYTVVFSFVGYKKIRRENINVFRGKITQLPIVKMKSNITDLEGVVIKATLNRESENALLQDQKNAEVIKQAIGSEELSRKGIGNVAEGVKNITGISYQKNTGLIVRGLSERYNYLTVNGLPIITGNPDKKIIPLQRFTTDIVRNINVFKTFNTKLQGDFAGAAINVITKDIPDKMETSVKITFSGNSQTTFQNFKLDKESKTEWLGVGNNRKIPQTYDEELIQLGYESPSGKSAALFKTNFKVIEQNAPFHTGVEIIHGNTISLKGAHAIGYYVGLHIENNYHTTPDMQLASLNTQGEYISQYKSVQRYELSTQKSALLSLIYRKGENFQLKINNIFLNNTSNLTQEQYGYNSEASDDFFARTSVFKDIFVNQTQLLGDWTSSENYRHHLKFGVSYGTGAYNKPDRKMLYANGKGAGATLYIANSNEPNRSYSQLNIQNGNGYVKYTVGLGKKIKEHTNKFQHNLTVGAAYNQVEYKYFHRVIRLKVHPENFPGNSSHMQAIPLNTNNPDAFIQQGFQGGWLNYVDGSDASKFSFIYQKTTALYFNYDYNYKKWNFRLGVRGEYFSQSIFYKKPTSGIYAPYLVMENESPYHLMPALNIKYKLRKNSNLRWAISITNTRPRIREILPIRYLSGPFELVTGNPKIKNSTNYNLDIKYEIFPEGGGIFSATGFGKVIQQPIETVITPIAGGSSFGFANTEKALVYGVEIVYQTNFKNIFGWSALRNLKIGINTSILYSQITIDRTKEKQKFLTNDHRMLQGATPIIVNGDLSYHANFKKKWESIFTLSYNMFGKRIYAVGASNLEDTYQQPFHQLNFIWNNTMGKFSIGFQIENILNSTFVVRQTPTGAKNAKPVDIINYKKGINFSFSLGYHF